MEISLTGSARAAWAALRIGRLRALLIAGIISYAVAIAWLYAGVVSPAWAYTGLVNNPKGDGSLLVAYALALLPGMLIRIGASRPSDVIVWLLYVLAYVPSVVVPYYVLGDGWDQFPLTAILFVSFLGIVAFQRTGRELTGERLRSRAVATPLIAAGGLIGLAVVIAALGLPTRLPPLDAVHDTRRAFAESGNPLIGYPIKLIGGAVFPFVLAAGVRARNWVLILPGVMGPVTIYAANGSKHVLLVVVLVVALVVILSYRPQWFGVVIVWALISLMAAALVAGIVTDSNQPVSIFVRRLLFVPGQVAAYYYEFFTVNPPYLLSHSVLEGITHAAYQDVPPSLIASTYFDDPLGHANGNLWADAYANFRYLGIVAFTALLAVILRISDWAARGRDLPVAAAGLASAALGIANSALLTTVLTHGLALSLLLVLLLPRTRGSIRSPSRRGPFWIRPLSRPEVRGGP